MRPPAPARLARLARGAGAVHVHRYDLGTTFSGFGSFKEMRSNMYQQSPDGVLHGEKGVPGTSTHWIFDEPQHPVEGDSWSSMLKTMTFRWF